MYAILFDKCPVAFVLSQNSFISDHDQVFACSGEGYVQFAVHAFAAQIDQSGQLIFGLHAGRNNDNVSGASLVAFHSIDGDLVGVEPGSGKAFADLGDLCSPGRDDAEGFGRVPDFAVGFATIA